jgi:LacI family transcriptional regulator
MKEPMPEATLKLVAKLAGVVPAKVSRVVNESENVAAATREKFFAIIRDLDRTPNIHAASLRRKRLNDESSVLQKIGSSVPTSV